MAAERIELAFGEREVERLNFMMEVAGIGTREELVENAMSLLEWVVRERAAGNAVCSYAPDRDDATDLKPLPDWIGRPAVRTP